jgi:hypothetical protein
MIKSMHCVPFRNWTIDPELVPSIFEVGIGGIDQLE